LVQGGDLPQSVSQFVLVGSAREAASVIERRTHQWMDDEGLALSIQSDAVVCDSRCLTIGFRKGSWAAARCINFLLVAPREMLDEATTLVNAAFGVVHSEHHYVVEENNNNTLLFIDHEEVAPSGRSHCQHCHGLIVRGELRIRRQQRSTSSRVVFLHIACAT